MKKNFKMLAAGLLLAMSGISSAQTTTAATQNSATLRYDLLKLQNEPQVITIYPNMKTPVIFDDQILEIVSGAPDLFTLDMNANRTGFYISGNSPAGTTDLIVTTASNITVMFVLKLAPVGLKPQRVEVTMPTSAYTSTGVTRIAATNVVPQGGQQSAPTRLSGQPIRVEQVAPTNPAQTEAAPAMTPTPTLPAPVIPEPGLKQTNVREGSVLKINYTLVPEATGTFDPKKMTVLADGKPVRYRLIRRNGLTPLLASAMNPETATIAVDGVDAYKEITVTWVLSTSAGDKSFTETIKLTQPN